MKGKEDVKNSKNEVIFILDLFNCSKRAKYLQFHFRSKVFRSYTNGERSSKRGRKFIILNALIEVDLL